MHILLTNDDGPPSPDASPYIATFVRTLTSPPFNHTVSIVLPTIQRSWIGKAHLLPPSAFPPIKGAAGDTSQPQQQRPTPDSNEQVSDLVTPRYYSPSNGSVTTHPSDADDKDNCWVLVPGTPSTCVQLGLFHLDALFPHRAPLSKPDLVISGPNYGRNTSAAFALSSGTLGGALEAAVCGVRAVAVSFAFFTRRESGAVIEEACKLGARVVDKLYREWDVPQQHVGEDKPWAKKSRAPDVYNVNIPLHEGISECPVRWAWMLDNKWSDGSLYKIVDKDGEQKNGETASGAPVSFKWAPSFQDVWKTVENSVPGNDALLMKSKESSVTPLVANYESLYGIGRFEGEFKL